MWDLVPWAARWAEGQSKKSQKYLADNAHISYVSPSFAHVGSQEKAVFFSRERAYGTTHTRTSSKSKLALAPSHVTPLSIDHLDNPGPLLSPLARAAPIHPFTWTRAIQTNERG